MAENDKNKNEDKDSVDTSVPEFRSRSKSQIYKRFAPILNSMHRHLATQTFLLNKLVNITVENAEKDRRQEKLGELEPSGPAPQPERQERRSFDFDSFGGAFSGGLLGGSMSGLLDMASKAAAGGALLAILSGPVREFTHTFAKTILEGMGLAIEEGSFREGILKHASNALPGALTVGFLFGRKFGVGFAIIKTLVDSVSESLTNYLQDEEGNTKALGYKLDDKDVGMIEMAVAGFLTFAAPSIMRRTLGGLRFVISKMNFGALLKDFSLGAAGRTAMSGLARAGIAALFGPIGLTALIGGMVATTIWEMKNYAEDQEKQFRENIQEKIRQINDAVEKGEAVETGFVAGVKKRVGLGVFDQADNLVKDAFTPEQKNNTVTSRGGLPGAGSPGREVPDRPATVNQNFLENKDGIRDNIIKFRDLLLQSATNGKPFEEDFVDSSERKDIRRTVESMFKLDEALRNDGKEPLLSNEEKKLLREYITPKKTTAPPSLLFTPSHLLRGPSGSTIDGDLSYRKGGSISTGELSSNATRLSQASQNAKKEETKRMAQVIAAPIMKGGNSQVRHGDVNTTINNYRLSSLTEDRALPFVS